MTPVNPQETDDDDILDSGWPKVWPAVVVLIALIVFGFVLKVSLTDGHSSDRRPEGRSGTSAAVVTPPATVSSAADVLLPGLSVTGGPLPGSTDVMYLATLVNGSNAALSIEYPIEVRGPGGTAIPVVLARIVTLTAAQRYLASNGRSKPPAVNRIAPRQAVDLLIQVHRNCDRKAPETRWPNTVPVMAIHLLDFQAPATFTLSPVIGGYAHLIRLGC